MIIISFPDLRFFGTDRSITRIGTKYSCLGDDLPRASQPEQPISAVGWDDVSRASEEQPISPVCAMFEWVWYHDQHQHGLRWNGYLWFVFIRACHSNRGKNNFLKIGCLVVYFVRNSIEINCEKNFLNWILFRGCSWCLKFSLFRVILYKFEILSFIISNEEQLVGTYIQALKTITVNYFLVHYQQLIETWSPKLLTNIISITNIIEIMIAKNVYETRGKMLLDIYLISLLICSLIA